MNETTTRRSFVKAATGLGMGCFLSTSAKGETKNPVLGAGEHSYECIHGWGQLPEGHDYGGASHGVSIAESGLIYISHQGRPGSVFVFEPDGSFVRAMFAQHMLGKSGAERARGHGIDIRREADGAEYIYLSPSDSNLAFTKATLEGEIVWQRGRADLGRDADVQLKRYRPTNVSFAPDGSVYLGDGYGSNYIFRYSAEGEFLGYFGGPGKEQGQFATPHGQWLDVRDGVPKTVVCDRANQRLQWFDLEGNHLKTLGGFLFPADVDIRGEVMVVPDLHARITLLDGQNQVIAQLADDEQWRGQVLDKKTRMRATPELWQPGRFVHPHDACFDSGGNIFVTEWVVGGRVTKLRKV